MTSHPQASSLSLSRSSLWVRWGLGYGFAVGVPAFVAIQFFLTVEGIELNRSDFKWPAIFLGGAILSVFAWIHFRCAYPPSKLRTWGQRICVIGMIISPCAYLISFVALIYPTFRS